MRRLLLLPALVLAAPLLVASPASAATVNTFTIAGTTGVIEATVGTTLEVAWDVTAVDPAATVVVAPAGTAVDVVDGWDAATLAAATDASVDVTIPADATVGDEYTFRILVAEDGGAPATSDFISVHVAETTTIVTSAPPVVLDGCNIVVPQAEGVAYEIERYVADDRGGYFVTADIDAGDYPVYLYSDALWSFNAYPEAGYAFPAGTQRGFSFAVPPECVVPVYVEEEPVCQGVVITNTTPSPAPITVDVYFGDIGGAKAEGQFPLEPGASRRVPTAGNIQIVFGNNPLDLDRAVEAGYVDVEEIEVDQSCTLPSSDTVERPTHPTVAPAAGR